MKIDGENQLHENDVTWCAWKSASPAKSSKKTISTHDMMICTVTVTVTPAITAATISKKNNAPKMVMSVLFDAHESENKLSTLEPAGKVAITMKMSAETTTDQPEMNPRIGWSARRTHE